MSISPAGKTRWKTALLTHNRSKAQLKNQLLSRPLRCWSFWSLSVKMARSQLSPIDLPILHVLKNCDTNSSFLCVLTFSFT